LLLFFFQQEGSLCAQHCLNALLQGQYFSPVELADIAQQLDESEREQMAVGGLQTEEYRRFMKVKLGFNEFGILLQIIYVNS
jgi:ataxin-3